MNPIVQCADGRINDPSHFLNFVDRNCVPYSYLELFLFAGGCLMWVVAYAIIIRDARKYSIMDMAAVAGCSNFAWETVWSWAFKTDMGWFLVWTYRAWFFLDIYIFYLLLKHGASQVTTPMVKKHFKALCWIGLAGFNILYYFFIKEGHDTLIGANSAYIAQMFVSVCSLLVLWSTPDLKGLSWNVAWLRSFGTGANTVFMFMHYPGNHFLHSMAAGSFVIDMYFLWTFLGYRKALRGRSVGAAAVSDWSAGGKMEREAPALPPERTQAPNPRRV